MRASGSVTSSSKLRPCELIAPTKKPATSQASSWLAGTVQLITAARSMPSPETDVAASRSQSGAVAAWASQVVSHSPSTVAESPPGSVAVRLTVNGTCSGKAGSTAFQSAWSSATKKTRWMRSLISSVSTSGMRSSGIETV